MLSSLSSGLVLRLTGRACSGYQGGTVFASSKSWARAGGLLASLLAVASCTEELRGGEPGEAPRAPEESKTADPYDDMLYRLGVVPLHAGFSPDPRVVSGTALGEIPARSIHRKCKGWISETPDYLLDADTAFFDLHILGRSRSDTLLVVRKPDGSVLCNDNRSGTKDPMLRSHFPIGTTQVWIGVHDEGATAEYRLGFSEVKWQSLAIPLPETN